MSNQKFDALSEGQKDVAEVMVDNAIERKKDKKVSKISQIELAEIAGVSDRTIRNWLKDERFLEYVAYISNIRLQAHIPDFAAVLIANLEKGQNVSTKQLELIAKFGDWLPDKDTQHTTLTVDVGHTAIEDRIKQLELRAQQEIGSKRNVPDFVEAEYRELDDE